MSGGFVNNLMPLYLGVLLDRIQYIVLAYREEVTSCLKSASQ